VDDTESAEEALSLLRAAATGGDPYGVALIEMTLPGMEGEQLGWAIRAEFALDATRTVLLTNVGRRGDASRAQSLGFSAYLLKPVQWSELYDALIEVVGSGPAAIGEGAPALVTRHSVAEARRSRVRILLVEDNSVNQLVANWALQRLGYTIDIVGTAGDAIAAWEKQRYDLILMDIQLPDWDGLKAAEAIRARERGGNRTPIIAMTGNALNGDRERCIEAGMDDYLSKPIDLGEMCSKVEQWASPGTRDAAPGRADADASELPNEDSRPAGPSAGPAPLEVRGAAPEAAASESPARELGDSDVQGLGVTAEPAVAAAAPDDSPGPPIDSARLEDSSMGIPALREALVNTFLADTGPRMERLAQAITAGDTRLTEFEAHGLEGMCATLGATLCARLFGEIEQLARGETLEDAARLIEEAKAAVLVTEQYLVRLENILHGESRAAA